MWRTLEYAAAGFSRQSREDVDSLRPSSVRRLEINRRVARSPLDFSTFAGLGGAGAFACQPPSFSSLVADFVPHWRSAVLEDESPRHRVAASPARNIDAFCRCWRTAGSPEPLVAESAQWALPRLEGIAGSPTRPLVTSTPFVDVGELARLCLPPEPPDQQCVPVRPVEADHVKARLASRRKNRLANAQHRRTSVDS